MTFLEELERLNDAWEELKKVFVESVKSGLRKVLDFMRRVK